jgi:hypothetical protein
MADFHNSGKEEAQGWWSFVSCRGGCSSSSGGVSGVGSSKDGSLGDFGLRVREEQVEDEVRGAIALLPDTYLSLYLLFIYFPAW